MEKFDIIQFMVNYSSYLVLIVVIGGPALWIYYLLTSGWKEIGKED